MLLSSSGSYYDPSAAAGVLLFSGLVLIGFQLAMGYISKNIQEKKGYKDSGFWIGFFLGLIGIAYSAGLPDLRLRDQNGAIYRMLQSIESKISKLVANKEQITMNEKPKSKPEDLKPNNSNEQENENAKLENIESNINNMDSNANGEE